MKVLMILLISLATVLIMRKFGMMDGFTGNVGCPFEDRYSAPTGKMCSIQPDSLGVFKE